MHQQRVQRFRQMIGKWQEYISLTHRDNSSLAAFGFTKESATESAHCPAGSNHFKIVLVTFSG